MIASFIKKLIHNRGGHLFGPHSVPKGVDLFHDLQRFGYTGLINTVFDVGANVGKFAMGTSQKMPNVSIWCFEPVESTFRVLKKTAKTCLRLSSFTVQLGQMLVI